MVRHVEIEHVAHVGDVEPAGGDVGGDQERGLAAAEPVERGHARGLVQIAVQRDRGKPVAQQRAVQHGDLALAIAEHDGVLEAFGADQAAQRFAFCRGVTPARRQPLRRGRDRGGGTRHFHLDRIVQEGVDDAPYLRRHGRGEEQRLARERHQLADALDVGNEAHVEHPVGLIDDQELDAGHQQPSALVMVEQAPGRRDQHVGAAHQLGVLIVERYAPDDERDVELVIDAVFGEVVLDLGGELTRGLKDERARHACAGAALFEHGQHRQHEGGGLAGAGLGDAEHVAARQHVRDRLFLDRGGGRVSGGSNRRENLVGQAEMGKRHATSKVVIVPA